MSSVATGIIGLVCIIGVIFVSVCLVVPKYPIIGWSMVGVFLPLSVWLFSLTCSNHKEGF